MKNILIKFLLLMLPAAVAVISSCGSDKKSDSENTNISASVKSEITRVVGIGKIEPEHEIISLAAASGGIVSKVMKNDGERAEKGEALVLLDSEEEELGVAQLRAQVSSQENQVIIDRLSVEETELRLADKKRLMESTGSLLRDGAETAKNYEDLKTEVAILENNLEKAKAVLALSNSGLSKSRAELQSAIKALEKRTLRAPSAGVILDMKCLPGSSLPQFGEYALFAPDGNLIARCEIDEMLAGKIKTGQKAEISLVGNSDAITTGKVVSASPFLKRKSIFSETPGDREDRRVREVVILLEEPADLLINSMIECKIQITP
ncbi:MAG: efflux RND transporter periplasmic adaptor subunit [Bacteroidales bacterium]|nr:efflux RND transporter periplasmic adaptor subunit [Bacteroidales bacterium]